MSDGSNKPVIFISYCQKDRSWLDYVRSFFEPLARQCTLLLWDDENLVIGGDWRGDIYAALDECSVFILLLSRYSLASAFILDEEVPRILKRPKDTVRFCPIVVTPYYVSGLDWLDPKSRRPPDNKALSELLDAARDREMAVIAEQIDGLLRASPRKSAVAPPQVKTFVPARDPVASPRAAFPSIVDYGRLPETPYKTLVGRDAELQRLDEVWADERTRVISLVAWGGAGKTSLVIEWLTRVRNDGYRNADAVLCWSFYSQGTTESAASGEGFLDWALGKLRVKMIDAASSTAKGERLADEMSRRRVLLVLDGLEPLQYGPEGQQGALKDLGLRTFLRQVAVKQPAAGHSLVVLTSRLAVYDLRKWQHSTAPLIDLTRLSDEAGAALLAGGGVTGPPEALREVAHDFAGHALALSLLAAFLRFLHGGDVSRRDHVRALTDTSENPGHDQVRRVMEAYSEEWLAREPVLLAIMYLVGLFDRPASVGCILALRSKPVIDGLTDLVVDLGDDAWRTAIGRLREVRLIDPEDPAAPDALDAHPLVREWFGRRLSDINKTAWKAAHGRLYEHLRDATQEGATPTLENLAPLYQAVTHGCRAGRYGEALEQVFIDRIFRRQPNGEIENYAGHKLGAHGNALATLFWFFEKPYESAVSSLSKTQRAWVLAEVAFSLQTQARFDEALPAMRASYEMFREAKDWGEASTAASNISEVELLIGEIASAVASAREAVARADTTGDNFHILSKRMRLADVLHAAGQREEAQQLFAEAEGYQQAADPGKPLLVALGGFLYCDLLLAKGEYAAALNRAGKTIIWARSRRFLLDEALDTLTLGRADLGLALSTMDLQHSQAARDHLDGAVDRIHVAGYVDELPRCFLARARFRRSVGDWLGAERDLDEMGEIAEPVPMKLYLCDMVLERARLAFAQIEAFAPLNGLTGGAPIEIGASSSVDVARRQEEAAKFLAIAADYIETCGYHRRDEELAELEAVLRGERKFADLPPRV